MESPATFRDLMSQPQSIFAGIAIIVSVISFIYTLVDRRRVRIESVIQGLQGNIQSVTYTALQIRLTNLLSNRNYRRALISALLLAWNFEQSDRARASVLTALLEAKRKYPKVYDEVVLDLTKQFNLYGAVKGEKGIERGTARLKDVLDAIKRAEETAVTNPELKSPAV